MRLKLVPQNTSFDFFSRWKIWLGISGLMMVIAFTSFMLQGLNFGIDFRGGTTIRAESAQPIDVGAYRDAIAPLDPVADRSPQFRRAFIDRVIAKAAGVFRNDINDPIGKRMFGLADGHMHDLAARRMNVKQPPQPRERIFR